MLGLARFGPVPCIVLGQDRRGQTVERPLGPGALRVARRACGWPWSCGCRC
jgi:acetyl-CoA carboxylase carboxyl transferase subunit beta